MRKCLLFVLLSVATVASAQIDLGPDLRLFVGAGVAYQNGKIAEDYSFEQPGGVIEFGAVYRGKLEVNADVSLAKNMMISLDINGRTYLSENFDLLYGVGYGGIFYDDMPVGVVAEKGKTREVTKSGDVNWPHANVGVIYGINDNMDLRVVGVAGYSEGVRYVGEGRNWHFVSQLRASVVWNF